MRDNYQQFFFFFWFHFWSKNTNLTDPWAFGRVKEKKNCEAIKGFQKLGAGSEREFL